MEMKKLLALSLSALVLTGCAANSGTADKETPAPTAPESTPPVVTETPAPPVQETPDVQPDVTAVISNGVYRGAFTDPKQVEVEFEIQDNTFTSFKFRALTFKEANYLKNDDATITAVGKQYTDLGDYLVGKDFSAVEDLYAPGSIAADVDGFTAATIRSSKVISAINDAVSRNPYKLTEGSNVVLGTYADGTYRGGYLDSTQVQVEFTLKDNKFESMKLRSLSYKGNNYLKTEDPAMQGIAKQYGECVDYLIGKDVSAILDLYAPGNVASDVDAFTAATLRSGKLISAIFDGLNRGVYKLAETSTIDYSKSYENGTYRGSYLNAAEVEVEFVLTDNVIESIKFRALGYKGSNYLKSEVELEKNLAKQYQAVLDHLAGQPLSALKDAYTPGDFVEDIDAFSGATIRSSKIISAINNALSRGPYKLAAK